MIRYTNNILHYMVTLTLHMTSEKHNELCSVYAAFKMNYGMLALCN